MHLVCWHIELSDFWPLVFDLSLWAFVFGWDVDPDDCFAAFVALQWPCAASSDGRSTVMNSSHIVFENLWRILPRRVVEYSSLQTVDSVCRRNFAKACHVASSKRRLSTITIFLVSESPPDVGIVHWQSVNVIFSDLWYDILPEVDPWNHVLPISSSQKHWLWMCV